MFFFVGDIKYMKALLSNPNPTLIIMVQLRGQVFLRPRKSNAETQVIRFLIIRTILNSIHKTKE